MKRSTSGYLILENAIEGFIYHKTAEGLSPNTLVGYKYDLLLFGREKRNVQIDHIESRDIVQFLTWLREEYRPKRVTGTNKGLSRKSIRNKWIALASFFRWASLEFGIDNPINQVPAPRFEESPVLALTKSDIESLLKATKYSQKAKTNFRSTYSFSRPTALRDRAIILTLLDTGLRSSELCALKFEDLDLALGKIIVKHGNLGGAKGGQGRTVFVGKATRKAIWKYLASREDKGENKASLFMGKTGRPLSSTGLRHIFAYLSKKSKINHCVPHQMRHTFAITYLRSGGDVLTLQALLGHRSLQMVRHYAKLAELDLEKAHRKASPVDNWRL